MESDPERGTLKSLMVLWKKLAEESASWCHTSATLDYKKLERRYEHEGDAFLTITLPQFGKDFERSLELGKVENGLFQGFALAGGLPRFLGGFLSQVFDRGTGVLLDDPSIDCILAVRQLTLLFAKILIRLPPEKERDAMLGFVQVDAEVEANDEVLPSDLLRDFERMSLVLWADVCTEVDREIDQGLLRPGHGPGATAERLLGNKKYEQQEWTTRLESVFPFLDNALPSARYWSELEAVNFREPDAERPVRVIAVPKTQKTPRIIAIEPTCMQFMQQAISKSLIQKLERRRIAKNRFENPAFSFVGFRSQDPNREMAREGSRKQTLATLDMSEASDRVSNQHVVSLFKWWPLLSEAVQATRSTKADVFGHGVIPLSKFASMGSALCFPVEAMVFTTVIFLALEHDAKTRFTREDILSLRGRVRVYGDDIVVPVDSVDSVISYLGALGLKVNKSKSFWNGKFRESCGGDYYDGEWVTPVRIRRMLPSSLKQADEVISLVSLRNQLYFAGYWQTCEWLDRRLSNLLGAYPVVHPTSPILGRHSVLPYEAECYDEDTHSPLVRGWVTRSKTPRSDLDGTRALVKWYLKEGDEPIFDKDHLRFAGRPRSVGIKIAKRAPF
jgi:hypothetical protein